MAIAFYYFTPQLCTTRSMHYIWWSRKRVSHVAFHQSIKGGEIRCYGFFCKGTTAVIDVYSRAFLATILPHKWDTFQANSVLEFVYT